jgi:hypothetical protein
VSRGPKSYQRRMAAVSAKKRKPAASRSVMELYRIEKAHRVAVVLPTEAEIEAAAVALARSMGDEIDGSR